MLWQPNTMYTSSSKVQLFPFENKSELSAYNHQMVLLDDPPGGTAPNRDARLSIAFKDFPEAFDRVTVP